MGNTSGQNIYQFSIDVVSPTDPSSDVSTKTSNNTVSIPSIIKEWEDPPSCFKNIPEIDGYIGCCKDTGERAIPWDSSPYISYDDCRKKAIEANSPYFGLQDRKNGGISACLVGNSSLKKENVMKFGKSDDCVVHNGHMSGGPWVNAVYLTKK